MDTVKHFTRFILIGLGLIYFMSCGRAEMKNQTVLNPEFLQYSGEDHCTFRMVYQGCACGDEYPQYVVDSVLACDSEAPNQFINREFTLTFSDTALRSDASPQSNCGLGCQYFILTGNAMVNGYGMYQFYVEKAERFLRPDCCEDVGKLTGM